MNISLFNIITFETETHTKMIILYYVIHTGQFRNLLFWQITSLNFIYTIVLLLLLNDNIVVFKAYGKHDKTFPFLCTYLYIIASRIILCGVLTCFLAV